MFECAEIMGALRVEVHWSHLESKLSSRVFAVCARLSLSPHPPGGQESGFDLWSFCSARKRVGNAQLLSDVTVSLFLMLSLKSFSILSPIQILYSVKKCCYLGPKE